MTRTLNPKSKRGCRQAVGVLRRSPMKEEGNASEIGRWLFHNHFLMTLLMCGAAMGFIAVGDWNAGSKHVPSCDSIVIDIEAGTVSGLRPSVLQREIIDKFPCYTGDTREGSNYSDGGGVFCKHHSLFFYTQADRIEIRKGFDGEIAGVSGSLTLESFTKSLGDPLEVDKKTIVQVGEIYDVSYSFAMPYGALTLFGKEGQIHALYIENPSGE